MATILSIPAELQKAIAETLDRDKDVLQLRQTCRELCAASHDTFVQRFFTTRTILYTKQGLELLHTLSAQRHLFGKLRRVHLKALTTRPIDDANPLPKQALDYMHFAEKIMEATQFGSDEVAVLTQILDNLAVAGSRPWFHLQDYSHEPDARLAKVPGLSKLSAGTLAKFTKIGIISPGCYRAKDLGAHCPLTSLILASASSKAPLTGLSFNGYGPLVWSRPSQISDELISRSLPSLTKLEMYLPSREYWPDLKIQPAQVLTIAARLEKLEVSFPYPVGIGETDSLVQRMDTATKEAPLQWLGIVFYEAPEDSSRSLLAFLSNHRETLKTFCVVSSWWPTEDAFYDFVDSVADAISLELISLGNILIEDENTHLTDDWGENDFKFRDINTNAAELRRLRKRTYFAPLEDESDSESDFNSESGNDGEDEHDDGELNADDALFFETLGTGQSLLNDLDAEEEEDRDSEEDEGKFDMDRDDEEEDDDEAYGDTWGFYTSGETGPQVLYSLAGDASTDGGQDHQQTLEDWF